MHLIITGVTVLFFSFTTHAQNPVVDTVGHPADTPIVTVPNGPAHNVPPPKIIDTAGKGDGNSSISSVLSPLLSYNFSSGNNTLGNLTPVINYGWTKTAGNFLGGKCMLAANPYSAGQINIKDSNAYLPALMLPGIAGLNLNMILTYGNDNFQFIWFPLNFGLKLNTNFQDSSKIILQHNIRTGFGIKYSSLFQLGIQYTWGWHNLTSESEQAFKKVFNTQKMNISYITVTLETMLNNPSGSGQAGGGNSSVLFLAWRCLTNKGSFNGLPNAQILTIGFRKDINLSSLSSLAPAARPIL